MKQVNEVKMNKVISEETHKMCSMEIQEINYSSLWVLVPNHLVDEDGCLDEEFGDKISGYVRSHRGMDLGDCYDNELEVIGDYDIIKDQRFDPDLPVYDEERMKEKWWVKK